MLLAGEWQQRTAPETRHCSRSAGQPWHRPGSRRARSSRQSTPGSAPGQVTLQMHQHGSVTIWQALNILDVQNTQPRGSPAMAVDIIASTSSPDDVASPQYASLASELVHSVFAGSGSIRCMRACAEIEMEMQTDLCPDGKCLWPKT